MVVVEEVRQILELMQQLVERELEVMEHHSSISGTPVTYAGGGGGGTINQPTGGSGGSGGGGNGSGSPGCWNILVQQIWEVVVEALDLVDPELQDLQAAPVSSFSKLEPSHQATQSTN
jgi:hypothetical protein